MELLRNWICGICAVSILTAAVQTITPKNAVSGAVRMIGALIMIIVLFAPLGNIDFSDFRLVSLKNEVNISDRTEKIGTENQKIQEDIIEDTLAAYIWKRVGCGSEEIRVAITCENGIPAHAAVTVAQGVDTGRVMDVIEDECGIEKENITIETMQEEA